MTNIYTMQVAQKTRLIGTMTSRRSPPLLLSLLQYPKPRLHPLRQKSPTPPQKSGNP